MVRKQIEAILDKVQNSTSCHQKYVLLLTDIYKKVFRTLFWSKNCFIVNILLKSTLSCVLKFTLT